VELSDLEPLSYFFGAFLGDGSAYAGSQGGLVVSVATSDKDIITKCYLDITFFFSDLRKGKVSEYINPTGLHVYRVNWYGAPLHNLIINAVGYKDCLPEYIWTASKEAKLDLLAGLMDTDGGISRGSNGEYNLYFTGGSGFISQFTALCESLDIIVGKPRKNNNQVGCYNFHVNKKSAKRAGFLFYCARKQEKWITYIRTK